MAQTPRRPARKRPQGAFPSVPNVPAENAEKPEQMAPPDNDGVDRDRILQEFEAALQANAELDAGERDEVLRKYREAMDVTPVELGPPDLEKLQADFRETIQRLVEMGVVDQSETGTLLQEFGDSLQPLRDPAFVKSQEYLRRLREDGEESAAEWLKETQPAEGGMQGAVLSPVALPATPAAPRRRRRS